MFARLARWNEDSLHLKNFPPFENHQRLIVIGVSRTGSWIRMATLRTTKKLNGTYKYARGLDK
jgi:hypothetical protein